MKHLLLLALLLTLAGGPLFAQDLLTKRNGEEFQVKVVEITPTEIKYRRTDNPDGPLIGVWKTDVFMVLYANGTKEIFNASTALVLRYAAPAPPVATAPAATPQPPLAPAAPGRPAPVVVPGDEPALPEPIHLDGPRLGLTFLDNGLVARAHEKGTDVSNVITQFGWQFESRLFRLPNGTSGLVELVPLVGGLDQGLFIPSISGLLGIRGPQGFEFGVGPNLTPLGAGLVLALGTSFHSGGINFPVNLAVVPGRDGARVSLVFGFNTRTR